MRSLISFVLAMSRTTLSAGQIAVAELLCQLQNLVLIAVGQLAGRVDPGAELARLLLHELQQLRAKIGADPTGEPFNSVMAIELHGGKPLNPLVNAGAMATVSLVNGSDSDEIWGNMIHNFNNFADTALTVNQEIYKSESATNQHNRGIAWLLDSYGYFYNTPPMIVDLYTRMCSLNITASQLALMGACYANGGVNPVSKKRVVKEENVPPILAEMCMSGLYDSTGDWMYKAGLPAKSGVGGGLVAVAPGKLAMAAFSPPLDPAGNTVKGQAALQSIIRELNLNLFRS